MANLFRNRREAGRQLASKLSKYQDEPNLIVLGLARGGVPVAYEVARALHVPMDVFLVRKLGVPQQPELAMGAIASGGARVMNNDILRLLHLPNYVIEQITARERQELERRERIYRHGLTALDVRGRTVILVDDGLATGASMRAAVRALRELKPARLVVAVPTASIETCEAFRNEVDEIICAQTPDPFIAVGAWYDDFSQTTDEEVTELLGREALERMGPIAKR